MDAQTIELLIQTATGAGGAVVVCLIVMAAGYNLIVKQLIPAHKETMNDFVKESRANRKVFCDAVDVMSRRLDKVEDKVGDIHREVHFIKEKL